MSVSFKDHQEFVAWNESMTRKYDSESYHLRSNFAIRWIERRRVKAILDFLAAGPADTVLEVGCGAGVVLEQIPAGRLIGLDLSRFILEKTKHRLAGRRAAILQADGEYLPFANHSLGKIVCTEVIEHVLEPVNVARELARVAANDSVIVISIPNEALIDRLKDWIGKLGLSRWLLAGGPEQNAYDSPANANEWHLHRFDLKLLSEVTAGRLVMVASKAIPFFWLPLRYVVQFRPA